MSKQTQKSKRKLNVVHDDQLEGLLSNLGLLDEIRSGKILCKFCRNAISLENLHSIFPESGDIKFVCNDPVCVKKLIEHINEKNI